MYKLSRLFHYGMNKTSFRLALKNHPLTHFYKPLSSYGDVIVAPKVSSTTADVDIVNYSLAGLFIVGYNQYSFQMSNGVTVYGPLAAFPQNAFSWNITSALDINEESLSLFFSLAPKLDVLLIGKGASSESIDHRGIIKYCWKHKVSVEIMSTPTAIGTFNFLNAEERYVAAAIIPPMTLDVFDKDRKTLKQLEAARRDIQISEGHRGTKLRQLVTDQRKLLNSTSSALPFPPTKKTKSE